MPFQAGDYLVLQAVPVAGRSVFRLLIQGGGNACNRCRRQENFQFGSNVEVLSRWSFSSTKTLEARCPPLLSSVSHRMLLDHELAWNAQAQ